eukprot:1160917-Pelagomonas_calceolata.AAC.4
MVEDGCKGRNWRRKKPLRTLRSAACALQLAQKVEELAWPSHFTMSVYNHPKLHLYFNKPVDYFKTFTGIYGLRLMVELVYSGLAFDPEAKQSNCLT